jgi:hypothetical protein
MTGERPESESYTWFDAAERPLREVTLTSNDSPLILTRSERSWHRDDAGRPRWLRTVTADYEGRPPGAPDLEVIKIDNAQFWQEVDSGRWDRNAFVWRPTKGSLSLRGYSYGVLGLHAITDFEPMDGEPPPDAAIWAVAQRKEQWTLIRNQAGQLEALQANHFDGDNRPVAGSLQWFERDATGSIVRLTDYDSGGGDHARSHLRRLGVDGAGPDLGREERD